MKTDECSSPVNNNRRPAGCVERTKNSDTARGVTGRWVQYEEIGVYFSSTRPVSAFNCQHIAIIFQVGAFHRKKTTNSSRKTTLDTVDVECSS